MSDGSAVWLDSDGTLTAAADTDGAAIDHGADTTLLLEARLNGEAFARFFTRNYVEVLEYFAVRVRAGTEATDLCAETFAAALEGLDRFDPGLGSGRQWLYGIARNLLFRFWRNARVSQEARNRLGLSSLPVDDWTAAAMSRAEASADQRFIERALGILPEGLREAVQLRVMDQQSYEDIAKTLDIHVDAARKRVSRGLSHLQDRFGDRL